MIVWMEVYATSIVVLLLFFYIYERAKAGPVDRRTLLVMTELAALFALAPATTYVLATGLLRGRK